MISSWVGGGIHNIRKETGWRNSVTGFATSRTACIRKARRRLAQANAWGRQCVDAGSELLILANDIAFNPGPFLSPAHFAEFIQPYLNEHVSA